MPHFSTELLDALLDGDPAQLEALRAVLGAGPAAPGAEARPVRAVRDRCLACRPAPLVPALPAAAEPRAIRRPRLRAPTEDRGKGGRPALPALRPRNGQRRPARYGPGQ